MEQTDPSTRAEITIDEHLDAHNTGFKLQTAGLIVILVVVTLAALGLFGDGVLSHRSIDNHGYSIRYEGFYRVNARTAVHVNINESPDSILTVSIPANYLKVFRLQSVVPAAAEMKSRDDFVHFVFRGTSGTHIAFYMSPEANAVGLTECEWQVNGQRVPIRQFIFP